MRSLVSVALVNIYHMLVLPKTLVTFFLLLTSIYSILLLTFSIAVIVYNELDGAIPKGLCDIDTLVVDDKNPCNVWDFSFPAYAEDCGDNYFPFDCSFEDNKRQAIVMAETLDPWIAGSKLHVYF